MAKNIFLASTRPYTGKSVICLGLINALRGIVTDVGYLKPVGFKYMKSEKFDKESIMIKEIFGLEEKLEYINPVSMKELNRYITNDDEETFYGKLQESYKIIQKDKDIVIIDGTDFMGMVSAFELDINADIANNLNAGIILIEDGHNKSIEEIVSDVVTGKDSYDQEACDFLGVIVNKVDAGRVSEIGDSLRERLNKRGIDLFGAIPYDSVLPKPRLNDIAGCLDARVLLGGEYMSNIATSPLVASMTIENSLKYIQEGSLVITGGDRDEILIGFLASLISPSYPNISGIVLTGGLLPGESIIKLLGNVSDYLIPILGVEYNTIEAANRINSLVIYVSSDDNQKIEIAKSLVYRYVDYKKINKKLNVERSRKRTPEIFKYEIIERARSVKKRIVLPEGNEERTLKAVEWVRTRDVAEIILLGEPDSIRNKARNLGISLDNKIQIINPLEAPNFEDYVNTFYALRKHKHFPHDLARDLMQDTIYYGTMMIYKGDADGLVSGAVHTTQHTIRPAFQIVKTKSNLSSASSVFFMCLKDRVLVYGDCAIIPNPNSEELADIAISSAETARSFEIEPYIAMLSYSTGKSGKGPEVDKVREATGIAISKRPDLLIEGPIQYDAAIDPDVAKIKMPDSNVAGRATVFIFPDLNTGNNTYKAVQRSAGAIAIGPVLQGLNKPVNDLSRGCFVEDIVYTIAITAIQAQNI